MTMNLITRYLLKWEDLNLLVIHYKHIRIYYLNVITGKAGGTLPCTLTFICILPISYLVKLKSYLVLGGKTDYVFKWRSQFNCLIRDIKRLILLTCGDCVVGCSQ